MVLLPLHNPVEIAEIGAFLDVITGGQFMLGVGLGYRPEEFQIFGVTIAERVSRLAEGVEIIRRLWTEDNVTHRGRHWSFENVTIRPRPAPAAAPAHPDGLAGPGRHQARGPIADGWLVVPVPRVDEFAAQAQAFTAARAEPACRGPRRSAGCSRWSARPTRTPRSSARRRTCSTSTRPIRHGGSRA